MDTLDGRPASFESGDQARVRDAILLQADNEIRDR
jgi:hypothetical protein